MVEECRNRGNGRRLNAIHGFRPYLPRSVIVGSNGMEKSTTEYLVNKSERKESGQLFRVNSLRAERLTLENTVKISHSLRPSLSRAEIPSSNHSSRDIQNSFLPFMISANTAPPKNTMCFRRGGSSILILNFCEYPINHLPGGLNDRGTYVQARWIAVEYPCEVQLFHLLLQTGR